MKKRPVFIYIMLSVVLLFAACGKDGAKTTDVVGTVEINVETTYPLTFTDQAGREVVLEKQPEKLVSSYYITTGALLALDLREKIVGVESNPEKRILYSKCAPEILETPQVGSPKEFDLEACAALQPDLVILPMRAKDMVEPLENLGIPVMVVNPESHELILEMLLLIGQATGNSDRAKELTDYIQEKVDFLAERTEGCERPTVYLGGNSSFLSTASKGMYQNDLITMAGGKNVAGEIDDTYWVESSYEQILGWDPQVIVMAAEAKYTMDEVLGDEGLQDTQAIRDQRVYKIPSHIEAWDSPVPSGFLGAVYLASVLHPELVSENEYLEIVEEYYERFYGFSYAEN